MQIPNFEKPSETRPNLDRFLPNFEDFTKLKKWLFFATCQFAVFLESQFSSRQSTSNLSDPSTFARSREPAVHFFPYCKLNGLTSLSR